MLMSSEHIVIATGEEAGFCIATTAGNQCINRIAMQGDKYTEAGTQPSNVNVPSDSFLDVLPTDRWFHLAIKWDGLGMYMLVDGIEKAARYFTTGEQLKLTGFQTKLLTVNQFSIHMHVGSRWDAHSNAACRGYHRPI